MKKGQFSIEFLIVLAVFLTVLATVSVPLYTASKKKAQRGSAAMQAREAANKIVQDINTLYASGVRGTTRKTTYWLPENTENVKVESVTSKDKLLVSIPLELYGTENIQIETILPKNFEVELGNIKLEPENQTYHETTMILKKNKNTDNFYISVSDNIKKRV